MASDALQNCKYPYKKRGRYFIIITPLDANVLEKALHDIDLIDNWCYVTHTNANNENSDIKKHHHVLIHTNRIIIADTLIHRFCYANQYDKDGNIVVFGHRIEIIDNDIARNYHNRFIYDDCAIHYSSKDAVNFWFMCGDRRYGCKKPN